MHDADPRSGQHIDSYRQRTPKLAALMDDPEVDVLATMSVPLAVEIEDVVGHGPAHLRGGPDGRFRCRMLPSNELGRAFYALFNMVGVM